MNANSLIRAAMVLFAAALLPACGSSSGGGSPAPGGLVAPLLGTLDDGTSPWLVMSSPDRRIVSRGGSATSTTGGAGGAISIVNRGGSNLRILNAGSVDTSFSVPENPVTLGDNPLVISVDTTLDVGSGLVAGVQSVVGPDGLNPATGLHVKPGATLTLQPHVDDNASPATFEVVDLDFAQGILIEGTIRTGFRTGSAVDRARIELWGEGGVVVAATGLVDTRGADVAAGADGGDGGAVYLVAAGSVINRGRILTSGGEGDGGGTGGYVRLFSGIWPVYHTGTLTTSGGLGNAGDGGAAGEIRLRGGDGGGSFTSGGVFASGPVTARGGHGATGGGDGGAFSLGQESGVNAEGPIVLAATVDLSGGDAMLLGAGGSAGMSVDFVSQRGLAIWAVGGEARVSGSVVARGGDGQGGAGGNGAPIRVTSAAGGSFGQPVGGQLLLGADLDCRGGSGSTGGTGGAVSLSTDAFYNGFMNVVPGLHPVWLVGYSDFDLSGGSGASGAGGAGGLFNCQTWPAWDPGGNLWLGSILNQADVVARGGNSSGNTPGGNGGEGRITTTADTTQSTAPLYDRRFINRGAFDLRGGNGGSTGGVGGAFTIFDRHRTENTGAIVTSGGLGGTGAGGAAGRITIGSDGVTINRAALTANAGSSTGDLGASGIPSRAIVIEGRTATHEGAVSARGGNSNIAGLGGVGGQILINSWDGFVLSVVDGTLGVQGGSGSGVPVHGTVFVDGIGQALVGGSIVY